MDIKIKSKIYVIAALLILLLFSGVAAAETDALGLEIVDGWHLIQSKADLIKVRDEINDIIESTGSGGALDPSSCVFYNYKLTTSLDFAEDEPWESITEFHGIFNGDNHTISNLILMEIVSDKYFQGLPLNPVNPVPVISYGFIFHNNGTIENLKLADASLKQIDSSLQYFQGIGLLVSYNQGCLFNCDITGTMKLAKNEDNKFSYLSNAGGLAGLSEGSISDCSFKGDIIFEEFTTIHATGGLAGRVMNIGDLSNCHFVGTLHLSGIELYNIGGLIGYAIDSKTFDPLSVDPVSVLCISDCSAEGDIIAVADYSIYTVGGLTGGGSQSISNSLSNVEICLTADRIGSVGGLSGILGYIDYDNYEYQGASEDLPPVVLSKNSYASGNITLCATYVIGIGGFAGSAYSLPNPGVIENCYVTGDILIDYREDSYPLVNSDFSFMNIGGFVGETYDEAPLKVVNCYALNEEIRVPLPTGAVFGPRFVYPFTLSSSVSESSFYWENMIVDLTFIDDAQIPAPSQSIGTPVPSSLVWNKTNWIGTGDWKLHTYQDFELPIFTWQENSFKAEALHLVYEESGGSTSGSGGGGAVVTGPVAEGSVDVGVKNETVLTPPVSNVLPSDPPLVITFVFMAIAVFVFIMCYRKEE